MASSGHISREQKPNRQLPLGLNGRNLLRWLAWLPLVIVVASGCWLRWQIAANELLWLDELHTGWAVKSGFAEMLTRSAQGNQAPLFFGLVWNVVAVFGVSEATLRLVSVVSGSLLMLVAAWLVWRWTNSCFAATVVAGLISVDDTFIWYATEARPYALLHLFSLLQIVAFLALLSQRLGEKPEARDAGKRVRDNVPWGFVLLSLCLLYTHYTSVFLLVSELVFLLITVSVDRLFGARLRTPFSLMVVMAILAIAVGASPLLLQMGQAFGRPSDWEMVASTTRFLDEQAMSLLAWFLLPISSVVGVWLFGNPNGGGSVVRKTDGRRVGGYQAEVQQRVFAIATIYLAPCALLFVLAMAEILPITLSRYLSSSVIAGPLFAATMLATLPKKQLWIAGILFLAATVTFQVASGRFVAQAVQQRRIPQMRIEDWATATQTINSTPGKDSHPVLLFGAVIEDASALQNRTALFQRYLQFPIESVYPLKQDSRFVFAGPTVAEPHFDDSIVDEVIRSGGAWVLVRHHRSHAISIVQEVLERIAKRSGAVERRPEVEEYGREGQMIHLISIDLN